MFAAQYWGPSHYGETYWPPIETISGGGGRPVRPRSAPQIFDYPLPEDPETTAKKLRLRKLAFLLLMEG
jgi:hypothetical protein